MDLKLNIEVPVFKRCCFFLPLRRGLIGWGYARLALNIVIITYMLIIIAWFFFNARIMYMTIFFATVAFSLVDVGFTGLFLFACHKKNFKLLRYSYLYSISWLIVYICFGGYCIITDISRMYRNWEFYEFHNFLIKDLVITGTLLFIFTVLQLYVILLTRSEANKLQNQSLEMQFVNNADEAEARCVSAEQRRTDNGHTSVQYTDDKQDNSAHTNDKYENYGKYTNDGHNSSVQHESY